MTSLFFFFFISPLFVLLLFIFPHLVVIPRSSFGSFVSVCVWEGEGVHICTCEMRHGVESIHNHMHLQ